MARATKFSIKEVIKEPVTKTTTTATVPVLQPVITQEHPFCNAKDAAYVPSTNKNPSTTASAPTIIKRPEAAYKTLLPIHNPNIATAVYKWSMEAPITITQCKLLSLSPEVQSQVRDATTTKWVPNKDSRTAQTLLLVNDNDQKEQSVELPVISTFAIPNLHHCTLPAGTTIIPDEFKLYYKSLKPGQTPDPDCIMVAAGILPVCCIHMLVNNSLKAECILDPGSQIIAMAEHICHQLGLTYNPSIWLGMQSANSQVNPSLGLAQNMPFLIGKLTFYLQVHMLKSLAYDILLGQPFESCATLQMQIKPSPFMIWTLISASQFPHSPEPMMAPLTTDRIFDRGRTD